MKIRKFLRKPTIGYHETLGSSFLKINELPTEGWGMFLEMATPQTLKNAEKDITMKFHICLYEKLSSAIYVSLNESYWKYESGWVRE